MAYAPDGGYEVAIAPDIPGNKGPLRFEEGVATDTDVPRSFATGAFGDGEGDGRGRSVTVRKEPVETQRERAHVGSASWIEAPVVLGEFVQGAMSDHPTFERVIGSEARIIHPNATRIG